MQIRKAIIVVLAIVVGNAVVSLPGGASDTRLVEQLLLEAGKATVEGRLPDAKQLSLRACSVNPADERCWIMLAETCIRQRNLSEADKVLDQGVLKAKPPRMIYATRSGLCILQHDYPRALAEIKTYQRLSPKDGNAWLTVALAHDLSGNCPAGLNAIDRYLKFAPKSAVGYEQKSGILLKMRRPKDVLACARSASSMLPSLTPRLQCQVQVAKGELALFEQHDDAAAIAHFQEACKSEGFLLGDAERIARLLVPLSSAKTSLEIIQRVAARHPTATTLTVLADCAARAGNRKVTEDALAVLSFRAPKFVVADIEAQTMFVLGDFDRSADAAQRALKEGCDKDGHVHKLLIAALQHKGEHGKASEIMAEAVQITPNDFGMLERHCNQLATAGHLAECQSLIDRFRTKNPGHTDQAALLEARVLVSADRYRQALVRLNQLIASNPRNSQALFLRGKIYKGLLLDDLAIADFSSALSAGEDRRKVYAARGECLARSKRIGEAREDFRRAAI